MTMKMPDEAAGTSPPKWRDRTIEVDGMDDTSVSKIMEALKSVKSLSVDAVTEGIVKLRAATREESIAACAAIKTAGFECREAPRRGPATS